MTDEGMEIIGKLAQLSQLQLFNTSVTDAGVVHLRNLKSLEFLNLSGNGITDAALENLREHDKLTSIWLANTFVTRQAAEDLARHLPSLRASSLEGLLETPLSAESLQAVREIQALGGSVTPAFNSTKTCVGLGPEWKGNDADLDKLYVLPNVTQLYIAYPATDSIIPHIEALTTLEHLYLRDTRLTDAALDRLGTSLPKLKIDIINEGS
jgi:Leucine-rich repeat (LRR) protein